MNIQEEFRKFAVKDRGIGGIHVDKYAELSGQAFQNSLTPYIIEERRMNATVLDVFSRLRLVSYESSRFYERVQQFFQYKISNQRQEERI